MKKKEVRYWLWKKVPWLINRWDKFYYWWYWLFEFIKELQSFKKSPLRLPKCYFSFGEAYFTRPSFQGLKIQPLQWKTKWGSYRHEHSPRIILRIGKWEWGWIWDDSMIGMCKWEAWLVWKYQDTNKFDDRVDVMFNYYGCEWGRNKITTDYYLVILKEQYIERYIDFKEKQKVGKLEE